MMRALLLVTLIAGCAEDKTRFPVVISAVSDDGTPIPDLPITIGRIPAGVTDGEGKLRARVTGREGQRILVETTPPGVAKPNSCVSWSTSPHVAPPCTRTLSQR